MVIAKVVIWPRSLVYSQLMSEIYGFVCEMTFMMMVRSSTWRLVRDLRMKSNAYE